ncbi:MAG: hypothetical protein LBI60_05765 [Bacteroidales bacterium]|jgi:tRNA U34 2-thiouridine synthase MnmA/TrmU|nr:hypothetical protein [Bacteroidales bacterium]
MLSEKQIYILNKNNVQVRKNGGGYWYYTIGGRTPIQGNSLTEEGALKKAIGYLMSSKKK